MLDVFKTDAYGLVSMTAAIEKLPYIPATLKSLGLFTEEGIRTTTVVVEYRHGKISLVQTAARGSMPRVQSSEPRKTKAFPMLYLPENDTVMADEVQGVRAFGKDDDTTEGVAAVVNKKLARLKQNIEATHEWHRLGAVLGVTFDADGTTELFDWYDEFSLTQDEVEFDFSNANFLVSDAMLKVERNIEDRLGSKTYDGLVAICGNDFFDNLVHHPEVRDNYKAWQTGSGGGVERVFNLQGENVKRKGFPFAGVTWINYRGRIGANPFFPTDEARFVPKGVPELLSTYFAPAPFIETVNTVGRPWYAKQRTMEFDVGVELHVNSSPLMLPTQPELIVKGVMTARNSYVSEQPAGF